MIALLIRLSSICLRPRQQQNRNNSALRFSLYFLNDLTIMAMMTIQILFFAGYINLIICAGGAPALGNDGA